MENFISSKKLKQGTESLIPFDDNLNYVYNDYFKNINIILNNQLKKKHHLIYLYKFLIEVINSFYSYYYYKDFCKLENKYKDYIEGNLTSLFLQYNQLCYKNITLGELKKIIYPLQNYIKINKLIILTIKYLKKIFDNDNYFDKILNKFKNFENLLDAHEELDYLLYLIENNTYK